VRGMIAQQKKTGPTGPVFVGIAADIPAPHFGKGHNDSDKRCTHCWCHGRGQGWHEPGVVRVLGCLPGGWPPDTTHSDSRDRYIPKFDRAAGPPGNCAPAPLGLAPEVFFCSAHCTAPTPDSWPVEYTRLPNTAALNEVERDDDPSVLLFQYENLGVVPGFGRAVGHGQSLPKMR